MGWLVQTRPEIACSTGMMAQVTEDMFLSDKMEKVRVLNKAIRTLKSSPQRGITLSKLGEQGSHIRVYSDGAFSNIVDLSSQIGYIVFLCDDNDNSSILAFRSFQRRRVVRSVLGAEVCAFADAFDEAYSIQTMLTQCFGKKLPLRMYTDSKSLFDVIVKESTTTEKRMSIDLRAVNESYRNREVSDIAFIRSHVNPADALT